MRTNKNTIIFGAVVAVFAVLTLIVGYTAFSLHGFLDSTFFLPPAVSLATGQGFVNHITDLRSSWGDPTGEERYLYFPPLYPLFLGALLSPSLSLSLPAQTFLWAGVLSAVTVILLAVVFYKLATLHGRRFNFFAAALSASLLAVLLRSFWLLLGRPETLENLLLAIALILAFFLERPRQRVVLFAIILGLMAATHPFGAIFFAAFIGLFFSFFYELQKKVLSYTALTYALGFVAFVLIMQLSPHSLGDTLAGVWRHSTIEAGAIGLLGRLSAFLGSSFAFLYGVGVVFVAAFAWHFYSRYRDQIKTPLLFIFFSIFMAAAVLHFGIVGAKTYYVSLFSVVIFSALVYYLTHVATRRSVKQAAVLFLALFGLFSLRPVLALPSFLDNGTRIAAAREKFALIAERYPDAALFIDGSLWPLSEEYDRMHVIGDFPEEEEKVLPRIYALGQASGYASWGISISPAEFNGCPLEKDYFVDELPEFLGYKIAEVMPGYGFAAYVCR